MFRWGFSFVVVDRNSLNCKKRMTHAFQISFLLLIRKQYIQIRICGKLRKELANSTHYLWTLR